METFAEAQMKLMGWKPGEGLGKNDNGIAEPIIVSLKMDTAGVGFDSSHEHTFRWWEHVFNDAARKTVVKENELQEHGEIGEKNMSLPDTECNSSYEQKNAKVKHKLLYANFVKAGIMQSNGDILADTMDSSLRNDAKSGSTERDKKTKKKMKGDGHRKDRYGLAVDERSALLDKQVAYEHLAAACEGRTANRAARHGSSMGGKLRRLMEQEQMLASASGACAGVTSCPAEAVVAAEPRRIAGSEPSRERRKHRQEQQSDGSVVESGQRDANGDGPSNAEVDGNRKKKTKKRRRRELETSGVGREIMEESAISKTIDTVVGSAKKRKMKRGPAELTHCAVASSRDGVFGEGRKNFRRSDDGTDGESSSRPKLVPLTVGFMESRRKKKESLHDSYAKPGVLNEKRDGSAVHTEGSFNIYNTERKKKRRNCAYVVHSDTGVSSCAESTVPKVESDAKKKNKRKKEKSE